MAIIKTNSDQELVKRVRKALRENDNYCPSSTVKTEDKQCPCVDFLNMPAGECMCGLYVKYLDSDDA